MSTPTPHPTKEPLWYHSLVGWMFTGLGSTVGIALLAVWSHETRITTLEESKRNDGTIFQEIKTDLREIRADIRGLRSDLDRAAKSAP